MENNNGTAKTSVSFPVNLWNEIQDIINEDEITLSRFIQSASRLKIKARKIQNVREVLDILDKDEIEMLLNEIKKSRR